MRRSRRLPAHSADSDLAHDPADEEKIRGGQVFAVFKVEEVMDVGAVDMREQGEDLGGGPASARGRPGLQLRQPRHGHGRSAHRIEPEARRVRIDRVGGFLERPPERVPVRGAGSVAKPAPELAGDLVMAHTELAHPTAESPLLTPLTHSGH